MNKQAQVNELVIILRNDGELYKQVKPRLSKMAKHIKNGTWRGEGGFLTWNARKNVGAHLRGAYANCSLATDYPSTVRYAAAQEIFEYFETEMEQYGHTNY